MAARHFGHDADGIQSAGRAQRDLKRRQASRDKGLCQRSCVGQIIDDQHGHDRGKGADSAGAGGLFGGGHGMDLSFGQET